MWREPQVMGWSIKKGKVLKEPTDFTDSDLAGNIDDRKNRKHDILSQQKFDLLTIPKTANCDTILGTL